MTTATLPTQPKPYANEIPATLVSGRIDPGQRIRWTEGEETRSGKVCETRRSGEAVSALVKRSRSGEFVALVFEGSSA